MSYLIVHSLGESSCSVFPKSAFIVIDDLPRLIGDDPLCERLLPLVRACQQHNIRLLTTSAYPISKKIQDSLDPSLLTVTEVPPFSDYEAVEVFHAYGAPDSFLKLRTIGFVNRLTRQHPVLIAAAARYLQQQNWHVTDEALDALLRGGYAVEINDEVTYRLLHNIEDAKNRDLLYRLNLIFSDFSFQDVELIASIHPPIDRVQERLHTLVGLWLQRTTREYLTISPLIRTYGSNDLPADTRKACHMALGESILHKRTLNQFDTVQAVTHFASGEAYEQAGFLLVSALARIRDVIDKVQDYGLFSIWIDTPIPRQMNLGLRLYIRGLQIAIRHSLSKDISYLIADVNLLANESTEDGTWGIIGLLAVAGPILATYDPKCLNHLFIVAFRTLRNALDPFGEPLRLLDDQQIGSLVWLSVGGVTSAELLLDWINVLEQMPKDILSSAFASSLSENGCLFVTEGPWLKELDKPEGQRQWNLLYKAYDDLAIRVQRLNLELLWACIRRAQIVISAAFMHNFAMALEVANFAFSNATTDARVHFLFHECLGRQYIDQQDHKRALMHFDLALDQPTEAYPKLRIDALLSASLAIGTDDPHAAIQYALQAVQVAESAEQIPELDLVRALGELGIAYWLKSDLHSTFDAWDRAASHLLACRTESDSWKSIFVLFGHASGYFSILAHTGEPPSTLLTGESYIAPTRGFFLVNRPAIAARYTLEFDSFLYAQMAMFAEAVGKDDSVSDWALRGMDIAKRHNRLVVFSKLGEDYLPSLICNDRYAEALDVALSAGPIRVAQMESHHLGKDLLFSDFSLEEILGIKPNALWQKGEYHAAIIGLLPIAFRIGTQAIDHIEPAKSHATEIIALCKQISATAADPTLWSVAGDLLEKTYMLVTPYHDLVQASNEINADEYQVLRVIGYLGATLQREIDLRNALFAHFALMPYVFKLLRPPSSIYRRVIIPFFGEYWMHALKRARFHFRSPQLTEEYLVKARQEPDERCVQAILQGMAFGLGIKPPADVEEWLRGEGF